MIIQSESNLCPENKPFRLNDQSCENLASICFKTDYDQCNQLLNSCKQCPPSNLTLTMLRNIWEMSIVQSNLTQQIINKNIPNKFEQFTSTTTNKLKDDSCAIFLWAIIIIIILVVHFVETRFKLFTQFFQLCRGKNNRQYSLIKSRKIKYQNEFESRINQSIADLDKKVDSKFQEIMANVDKKFDSKFQKIMDKIDRLQAPSKDSAILQFQFDNIDKKPIELYVYNNHNIVQVKQQICAKLLHLKPEDYKIMKFKYNGIILNDDNQYLLENIDKSNTIVNCFIDSSMNASDIVVVKLQSKMRLPDIIQINKNQTIDQLKELIEKFINSKEFSLFKEILDKNQMKRSLLKLDSVCLEKELIDGDCVHIIQAIIGKLTMKSIFEEAVCIITAPYENTDQISSFIKSATGEHNWDPKKFALFYNNQYLEESKYICEYDICDDSSVEFCNVSNIKNLKSGDDIEDNSDWKLFHATDKSNNKILVKKYKKITLENWKSSTWMINELKTFLITKGKPGFVQLSAVYFNESNNLYVGMKNMKETLEFHLNKNGDLEKKLIYKWLIQILEGLVYLHKNNVFHRHLNPWNILVNNDNDLNLSSFNLSKYDYNSEPASINSKLPNKLVDLKVRYMAPELLKSEIYDYPCDIWSFGAVLLRIASGKMPLPNICEEDVKDYIINNGIAEYDLSEKYKSDSELKSIIDSCLKRNPDERCKIENLLKDLK